MYGDILEHVLLLLIKEAGHDVTGEQGEVEIDGILGHRDCKVDGITTDIKTASAYGFRKFKDGSLTSNDPFGYIAQMSAYAHVDKSPYGAFLAINKESGELAMLKVEGIDMIDPVARVARAKEVVDMSTPPEKKCYQPTPIGKKGNMEMNKNCTFCVHKHECWAGKIRKFQYSNGVKYLTNVVDTPRVEELYD
jgi:hypothetical protein